MIQSASSLNSESNGSIMKISPLAVFGIFFDEKTAYEIYKKDLSLTHGSKTVQELGAFYCLLIR